jgi:hypothetical protein
MRYSFLLALLWSALAALHVDAACVSSRTNAVETYGTVQLVPQNFPANSNAVEQGMNQWNASTCNANGTAFPMFQLSGGADRVITVQYINGPATVDNICGRFAGNAIEIFSQFRDVSGVVQPCPPGDSGIMQTVAHELGHVLGLNDVPSSSCSSYAMSGTVLYSNGTYNTRSVKSTECTRAASINLTPAEQPPDPGGDLPIPTVCHNCGSNYPEPMILDLDGDGIQLSGLDDPVIFDIDGDGLLDVTTWTARGSDDAFLVFDRDHDRDVDGAYELFGSATGRHSFEALSKLDWTENGGNGDGVIDHRDRAWHRLRLWVDADHDGIAANSGEIRTLASAGIARLELEYFELRQPDALGNSIDYRGRYVRRAGASETYWDMYGVTFQVR